MLQITKDNVGDIICKYKNGQRILITGVTDGLVYFQNESWGGHYCTDEHFIMGVVDRSPDAQQTFLKNQETATKYDLKEHLALSVIVKTSLIDIEESLKRLVFGKQIDAAEQDIAEAKEKQNELYNEINSKANERREVLLDSFMAELDNLPAGAKAVFYKMSVKKTLSGDGFIIDGNYYDKAAAEKHLLKPEEKKKSLSFDDLISSAEKRSKAQSNENRTPSKSKDEHVME